MTRNIYFTDFYRSSQMVVNIYITVFIVPAGWLEIFILPFLLFWQDDWEYLPYHFYHSGWMTGNIYFTVFIILARWLEIFNISFTQY
jgi:hypothetical protein